MAVLGCLALAWLLAVAAVLSEYTQNQENEIDNRILHCVLTYVPDNGTSRPGQYCRFQLLDSDTDKYDLKKLPNVLVKCLKSYDVTDKKVLQRTKKCLKEELAKPLPPKK